jgi:hypothetical protein
MMKKLTDWETGLPIYVDPSAITSCRRLPAEVYNSYDKSESPRELGERTRIDTSTDMFLVRETAEEVLGLPTE